MLGAVQESNIPWKWNIKINNISPGQMPDYDKQLFVALI